MWRCKECGGRVEAFIHITREFGINKNKELTECTHEQQVGKTKYTCMCGLLGPSYELEEVAEWIEETEAEKECREKFEKGLMRFFGK